MQTYQVEASKYLRGMSVVACSDGSPTSAVARLAEAFSGNRFSYREHGYLMNSVAVSHFMRALSLGCRAVKETTVEWEDPSGERFVRFDGRHPGNAFRCIATRD